MAAAAVVVVVVAVEELVGSFARIAVVVGSFECTGVAVVGNSEYTGVVVVVVEVGSSSR